MTARPSFSLGWALFFTLLLHASKHQGTLGAAALLIWHQPCAAYNRRSVLDGKYEITAEQEVQQGYSQLMATAPDGTQLRIDWYELKTREEELRFETLRKALRGLKRCEAAAVYDVVSRPGATYVVWTLPPAGSTRCYTDTEANLPESVQDFERRFPRLTANALWRQDDKGKIKLYALPFVEAPVDAPSETVWVAANRTAKAQPLLAAQPYAPAQAAGGSVASAASNEAPKKPRSTTQGGKRSSWRDLWERVYPWSLGVFLGLLGLELSLLALQGAQQKALSIVPEVRGQEINSALHTLYNAGFRTEALAIHTHKAANTVLDVHPRPGTPLRPGRTLSVSYATSASLSKTVQPVVGLTAGAAQRQLAAADILVRAVFYAPSSRPMGEVLALSALPDDAARQSALLLVSQGPPPAQGFLPELVGLPLRDALALAQSAGFNVQNAAIDRVTGSGMPADTVISQNIAPFVSTARREARVRLSVAAGLRGPSTAGGTPDLVGLSYARALQEAQYFGSSLVVEDEVSLSELPEGVILQQPQPHARLTGPIRVTLNVLVKPLPLPQIKVQVGGSSSVLSAPYTSPLTPGAPESP